jgi:hypothetical protein
MYSTTIEYIVLFRGFIEYSSEPEALTAGFQVK